jgi:hypothetical protein
MRKKVFLAGSFKTKEEQEFLRDVYDTLRVEYDVWWAHANIERGYGTKDENLQRKIVETEKMEVRTSHAVVAVMKRASFGTWGEALEAYNHNIPVIAYLIPENSDYSRDFESVWFPYHVRQIVYNKEVLLKKLREILG